MKTSPLFVPDTSKEAFTARIGDVMNEMGRLGWTARAGFITAHGAINGSVYEVMAQVIQNDMYAPVSGVLWSATSPATSPLFTDDGTLSPTHVAASVVTGMHQRAAVDTMREINDPALAGIYATMLPDFRVSDTALDASFTEPPPLSAALSVLDFARRATAAYEMGQGNPVALGTDGHPVSLEENVEYFVDKYKMEPNGSCSPHVAALRYGMLHHLNIAGVENLRLSERGVKTAQQDLVAHYMTCAGVRTHYLEDQQELVSRTQGCVHRIPLPMTARDYEPGAKATEILSSMAPACAVQISALPRLNKGALADMDAVLSAPGPSSSPAPR